MAQEALFYHNGTIEEGIDIQLAETTARHIVQVLRMVVGGKLQLTDGKGRQAFVEIKEASKKVCIVRVIKVVKHPSPDSKYHLCVAFTKNTSRNEWLLEKATELGVTTIIPLQAKRSERTRIRQDRWDNILIAALIQSQQFHLPILHELATLEQVFQEYNGVPQKFIAHCIDNEQRNSLASQFKPVVETLMLIGPEGDFTEEEITLCIGKDCKPVSLGSTRLRTETAAIAASSYINLVKNG